MEVVKNQISAFDNVNFLDLTELSEFEKFKKRKKKAGQELVEEI